MISGLLVTHNCEEFDYCYRQSLDSLMDVCDEVIVVDGQSTDGTREVLRGYEAIGVKVIDAEWKPVVDTKGQWLADLYNTAKLHSQYPYQLGLQADEVLHEIDRDAIRGLRHNTTFKRLNFWKDAQHFLQGGRVCGNRVFRFGAKEVGFVGDAEGMDQSAKRKDSALCIFHYGFLRRTEPLIAKSISFEQEVFGNHNQLFDQMKVEGRRPFDEYYDDLIPYLGTHPRYAHMWLEDRGYESGMYIAARSISGFIQKDWVGVEIGVFMGDSSRHLLRRCAFMYLIDPCEPYEGNPDYGVYSVEQDLIKKLNGAADRYELLKGMSHEVHDRVPEVDFVFIDGNHTYEYVSRDIELYWPKVRSGGFLSGHDHGPGFAGVVAAVTEFSLNMNLPVEIHTDCWLIRKP